MITIHTFGDSHSIAGWGNINLPDVTITTHHLGARLMHTFNSQKLQMVDLRERRHHVWNGDYVCFCFGEIDCRCHVNKHIADNPDVIKMLVAGYENAIEVVSDIPKEITVMVYNVIPTIERGTKFDNPMGQFAYQGTPQEIRGYTLRMNALLKEMCQRHDWIFMDIYDAYCNEHGFLNMDLADSSLHIKNPVHMENFLKNKILLDKGE